MKIKSMIKLFYFLMKSSKQEDKLSSYDIEDCDILCYSIFNNINIFVCDRENQRILIKINPNEKVECLKKK